LPPRRLPFNVSSERLPFIVLAIGVLAVSSAGVLVKRADAPALAIAAWRLGLASVPLLLYTGWRAGGRPFVPPGRPFLICMLAAVCLAAHFGFWFAGIQRTSVASSVTLVALQPLFGWLFSMFLLKEGASPVMVASIFVAACGMVLIGVGDAGAEHGLLGDFYSVLGAVLAALYLTIGRHLRSEVSASAYVATVYPAAAVLLFALSLLSGAELTGYSNETWFLLVLLALLPQLIGHTSINWALGYLTVPYVTVAILGEPIGATLLAMPVLGEYPSGWTIAGGLIIIVALAFGTREEARRARRQRRPAALPAPASAPR
jgi:drug/metabolite transporter (DMT)-like permease